MIDVISCIPYNTFYPQLIVLRYLKLLKIYEVKETFSKMCILLIEPCFSKGKQIQMVSLINLFVFLIMTAHVFACLWICIGNENMVDQPNWIRQAHEEVMQHEDFLSLYISAFYLVILTFTSIGYGDIRADQQNNEEMIYAILVMMVGIVIYGYMLGTFQQIMSDLKSNDLKADRDEIVDMFIIRLGVNV